MNAYKCLLSAITCHTSAHDSVWFAPGRPAGSVLSVSLPDSRAMAGLYRVLNGEMGWYTSFPVGRVLDGLDVSLCLSGPTVARMWYSACASDIDHMLFQIMTSAREVF